MLRESNIYKQDLIASISNHEMDFLHGKRVLLTGGTGLIGAAIVDLCLTANEEFDAGIQVILAVRSEAKVHECFGDRGDIKCVNYDALSPITFNEPVDYILHCAGNASPELYVSKAVETMNINYIGLNNLLQYAVGHGVNSVLYMSSSEIYGIKTTTYSFRETDYGALDILTPRSSYASSKRAAETLCCAYANEYGLRTLIARPGHVYGPTASKNDRRVSSAFAYLAANGESIILKSAGLQVRSYMYSLDCARAILGILENGQAGEAYNVCGEETLSIKEMALILAEAGNVEIQIADPTEKEKNEFNPMNNSSLNPAKLKYLGFKSRFTNQEGLCHTVKVIREILEETGA